MIHPRHLLLDALLSAGPFVVASFVLGAGWAAGALGAVVNVALLVALSRLGPRLFVLSLPFKMVAGFCILAVLLRSYPSVPVLVGFFGTLLPAITMRGLLSRPVTS